MAFLHDVIVALDYVMTHEVAYGLPWLDSCDRIAALLPDFELMKSVRAALLERHDAVMERFDRFEKVFAGVPSEVVADRILPTPVGYFEALVAGAKRKARKPEKRRAGGGKGRTTNRQ